MTSKPTSAPSVIDMLVFVGACFFAAIANYYIGTSFAGNWANQDFMTLWAGGRAVTTGADPYDPQVWPNLRIRYGSQWIPNLGCPYPLWTLVAFVPLSLLPLRIAAAVWMTLSEIAIVCVVLFVLRASGRSRQRRVLLVALAGALLSRPFISTLITGQLASLLVLLIASGLLLYERGRSFQAGFVLAMLLLKPNLFILFFPASGLLLLTRRDWQALLGLGSGGAGLLGVSWLIEPGWVSRWSSVTGKTSVASGTPSIWGLVADLVGAESWILMGTVGVCLVSGLTLFVLVRRKDAWLVGIGLAVCSSLFITPYLWAYDQLLLLIPALVAFQAVEDSSLFRTVGWWSSLVAIPWGLFWIAQLRGSDSLSGLVTLAVAGYLCISWRLKDMRAG